MRKTFRKVRDTDRPLVTPAGGRWELMLHPLQRQCSAAGDPTAPVGSACPRPLSPVSLSHVPPTGASWDHPTGEGTPSSSQSSFGRRQCTTHGSENRFVMKNMWECGRVCVAVRMCVRACGTCPASNDSTPKEKCTVLQVKQWNV